MASKQFQILGETSKNRSWKREKKVSMSQTKALRYFFFSHIRPFQCQPTSRTDGARRKWEEDRAKVEN